jgi:hypothetical protein
MTAGRRTAPVMSASSAPFFVQLEPLPVARGELHEADTDIDTSSTLMIGKNGTNCAIDVQYAFGLCRYALNNQRVFAYALTNSHMR